MTNAVMDIDPQAFVAQLTDRERMLIRLQKELYECSWDAILTDLFNRLEGRSYVFKLPNNVRADITRIQNLRSYEEQYDLTLSDLC